MIYSVRSDLEGFKAVTFEPGFNVVLAERTREASDRDSRNGSGKTLLLEIIHFCLGADFSRSPLKAPQLAERTFYVELDLRRQRCTVGRSTSAPNRVLVKGEFGGWPSAPREDAETGDRYYPLDEWTAVLGWAMFDLPRSLEDEKLTPTFRSLVSYSARRGRDAFSDPFTYFRQQPSWSKQVHTALLLGLGWEYARRAEELRLEETRLQQTQSAVASGALGRTIGELEAEKIKLEHRIAASDEELQTFQVHPQYQELEEGTTSLTSRVHELVNFNVTDRQTLEFYERSIEEERPPEAGTIVEMYREAEVALPDGVVRRLEDVERFHERIVRNRRDYLQTEIGRLARVVADRDLEIEALSRERAEILSVLREHGALDEFVRLQEVHARRVGQLSAVTERLAELRSVEERIAQLRMEREQLRLDARASFAERRSAWEPAVGRFGDLTGELYDEPGLLVLDVSNTGGLTFRVDIQRALSQGVQEMVVFLYDLMLAERWASSGAGPGFLFHDSTILDGVDERQRARALELAAESSQEVGFQYICTLNSGDVPWDDFREGFDLSQSVRLELTDAGETGGLLGFRY